MNTTHRPKGQTVELGERYYAEKLAKLLEPEHIGKYLVLDVDSGDYEIDVDHLAALERLRPRHPGKIFYATRVGYRTLGKIGGQWKART
ncbi:MAG TPA: hypothetical protein VGN88_14075 [Phycisphaerae bacterium]